jgi:Fuc2NAc and GlcNAc transferase
MLLELILVGAGAFLLAAFGTGWVRRLALARGILDTPNSRSSHTRVTPRGGGIAIASVALAGALYLGWRGLLDLHLLLALVGGGAVIALVGFMDDRRSVPVRVRLLAHALAAGWAVYAVGGLAPIQVGGHLVDLGLAGDLLATIAIVWTLNLFNFMDGIDGIAASEAIYIGVSGSVLAFMVHAAPGVGAAAIVFVAACTGFLAWNWPPARIFMGDAGSGFLGFFIAVLALGAARSAPAAVFVWVILGGAFFVDATVTFLRRLLRRERVHEAHRGHAYQRLSRRWRSHRTVDLVLLAINLLWLTPCAWLAAAHPESAAILCLAALSPLAIAVFILGAGTAE